MKQTLIQNQILTANQPKARIDIVKNIVQDRKPIGEPARSGNRQRGLWHTILVAVCTGSGAEPSFGYAG